MCVCVCVYLPIMYVCNDSVWNTWRWQTVEPSVRHTTSRIQFGGVLIFAHSELRQLQQTSLRYLAGRKGSETRRKQRPIEERNRLTSERNFLKTISHMTRSADTSPEQSETSKSTVGEERGDTREDGERLSIIVLEKKKKKKERKERREESEDKNHERKRENVWYETSSHAH